jgi:nitrite reductase/ring-hydroxylating ferredoxin subunit
VTGDELDLSVSPNWIRVARLDELREDHISGFVVDGQAVVVVRVGSDVFALGGTCTHRQAPLAEGIVFGPTIVCPWHLARFDVRSGRAVCAPATGALQTYDVTAVGHDIYVNARARVGKERST